MVEQGKIYFKICTGTMWINHGIENKKYHF